MLQRGGWQPASAHQVVAFVKEVDDILAVGLLVPRLHQTDAAAGHIPEANVKAAELCQGGPQINVKGPEARAHGLGQGADRPCRDSERAERTPSNNNDNNVPAPIIINTPKGFSGYAEGLRKLGSRRKARDVLPGR